MLMKIFTMILTSMLILGASAAFCKEAVPPVSSPETKTTVKPVMLGDRVLFHIATEAGGLIQAKRAAELSKRLGARSTPCF